MYKRLVGVFVALCVVFSFLTLKIISLNYSSYAKADGGTATKTLKVGSSRGNIYDIRMNKLVNSEEKTVCVAKPTAEAMSSVRESMSAGESAAVIKTLTEGYPAMFESPKEITTDDVMTFKVPVRYDSRQVASHIIGYLDGEGNGVSGIEKAYDDLLKQASGEVSVTFSSDANGRILNGKMPTVNDKNFNSKQGVVLTIDKDIQTVAENAMKKIKSGACAIVDCNTGAISAAVSRPDYDREILGGELMFINSHIVKMAFCSYSVCSVFKPILAACALESRTDISFKHDCKGRIDIHGTAYGCINKAAHGEVDFKKALQVSCNTYFIELTQKMKVEKIHEFCSDLGFGSGASLAEGMYSQDGFLPSESELENSGKLANFSFGQGELTATPVQLASAYAAIANGGKYKYPYLVDGTVDADGVLTETDKKPDSTVMSKETSDRMKKLLESVVTEGNAYYGEANLCSVAGKTGTAQSGIRKEGGDEVLRTWFVGFFPVSDPMYAVAVLCEDGISGGKDCGPVFSEIADGVMQIMIDRSN